MHALRTTLALLTVLLSAMAAHAAETPASAPATAPAASLLSNSHFTDATKDVSWPDDWPKIEGVTWEKEGQTPFLRLTSGKPGQNLLVYRDVTLGSPVPAALEIRVKVRYTDIKVGEKAWFDARIISHFKNRSGKVLKPEPVTPSFKGSSDGWVEKSYFVKVPVSAQTFEIMPTIFQAAGGTFDLAEVSVLAASADNLPKPPPIIPSVTIAAGDKAPPELHVVGTELQTAEGKVVWLQGLSVDSLQWAAGGEHIDKTIPVAIDQWHANAIRLAVSDEFWFGRSAYQHDGGLGYRKVVDAAVEAAASRGAYLILDLHRFGAPMPEHVEFWKDASLRYKNHPAVIFELFNEPHSISWKLWRDGGNLTDATSKHSDVNVAENSQELTGESSPGMQALLDAARSSGAHNIVIAGGLDWGYDLSGVAGGFALQDREGGKGIMYSSHIYPWKNDWQKNTLDAAAKYPIFVGEVGCPADYKAFGFIPPTQRYPLEGWSEDVLGMIQKNKLNWTGFSFHPKCSPEVILDWDYTPTPAWGVFVKKALSGTVFDMKKMR